MPLVAIDDFSDGLWITGEASPTTEQPGFAVPPGALLQADNVDFLPNAGVIGRRGTAVYNASPLDGPVVALRRYYARPVATERDGQGASASDDDTIGTAIWTNPEGALYVFDSAQAQVNLLGTVVSHYLVTSGHFFQAPLPADAVVTGIRVRIIRNSALGTLEENSVKLFIGGAAVGDEKQGSGTLYPQGTPAGVTIGTDVQMVEYGGAADLWGLAPTAAQLNAADFGVGFSAIATGTADPCVVYFVQVHVFYTSTEDDTFVAAHTTGGTLVYSSGAGGLFSTITSPALADPQRRPRIIAWPQKGKLFLFDGVNPVHEFNGSVITETPTNPSIGIPPRRGPFACLYKNRILACDPGELAYAVYACDINDETSWRPLLQLACNDNRGGSMTGLEAYGDVALLFKDTALFRFAGDIEFSPALELLSDQGCVAPDSIAVTPFGVVYVGREAVMLCDGDTITPLSDAIRALFVGRTSQTFWTGAVGIYHPRRQQYQVCLDPAAEDPETFVLHRITTPAPGGGQSVKLAWSRIPGRVINAAAVFDGDIDEGELYVGDREGVVRLCDDGDTDDGAEYSTTIVTGQRLMDKERRMGRVNQVRALYRGAAAATLGLRYDQVDTDDVTLSMGEVALGPIYQEPRVYVSNKAALGRFISLRVVGTGGPAFELHRVDLELALRGAKAWR